VLRELRRLGCDTPLILTANDASDVDVVESIRLGVRGLIGRDETLEAVSDCVKKVLSGGTCLDQDLVGKAMAKFLTRETALRELAQLLTPREIQVLQLVVTGMRNRDVASRLFVSEGTLKVHLHHIYEKLEISNREALIAFARARALA
jgi:DNA-binding NarL/FixJ family response regulator